MIVAVDPGKMTGLAWWEEGQWVPGFAEQPLYEAVERIHRGLHIGQVQVVVCEDFIISGRTVKTNQGKLWSLRGIGALEYLCRISNASFVLQRAVDAKTFATDEMLRTVGWYVPGMNHARDATRHLLLYGVNARIIPRSRLRVPLHVVSE